MSLYITTPIFYVNAQPHLGHAYTAIVADAVSRFRRLCNEPVFFQTGTDEHGDKVVQAAAAAGLSPKEYADRISLQFRTTWPPLEVEPDRFIRTTDADHIATVQKLLQKVYDQGDIYFSEYTGLYCQGCERFLTERELVAGECPDHLCAPAQITEQNYFFRMSRHQEWLVEHIQENPEWITPERYRNEVLSFLQEPLEDLCISRPISRLTWGIPLPFDDRFVTYVWFDALINYLSGIGYPDHPDFASRWQAAEHIIAKDILKPHAIYWPSMLRAMGVPPYRRLHVHGYWNINETKMSKSLGNVVRPLELVERYGAETVRYFLLREMSFGLDASFSEGGLIARQNSDLANDLGNLVSRTLTMVQKFGGGRVPEPRESEAADRDLAAAAVAMLADYIRQMEQFAFSRALQSVWEVIGLANKYIVANAPWELAKEASQADRLATVLYHLLETLRLIGLALQPVLPETSRKIAAFLDLAALGDLHRHGQWGLLWPGGPVAAGEPLFPRLEKLKAASPKPSTGQQAKQATGPTGQMGPTGPKSSSRSTAETQPPAADLIPFEAFAKLDLRVGTVLAAEKVPKADRLLKLTVAAPEERTVVAGVAEFYAPEEMIGRQVILVANLQAATIRGITSQGMVLAAKEGKRLVLATLEEPVQPGSKVS